MRTHTNIRILVRSLHLCIFVMYTYGYLDLYVHIYIHTSCIGVSLNSEQLFYSSRSSQFYCGTQSFTIVRRRTEPNISGKHEALEKGDGELFYKPIH
jgi:hypothetical protein